jgi:hypothetical protein
MPWRWLASLSAGDAAGNDTRSVNPDGAWHPPQHTQPQFGHEDSPEQSIPGRKAACSVLASEPIAGDRGTAGYRGAALPVGDGPESHFIRVTPAWISGRRFSIAPPLTRVEPADSATRA